MRLSRFGPAAALAAILIAAALALPTLGRDAAEPVRQPGFQDTVAKALPSVLQIRTETGLGSGVVFDGDGHVVTNAHVVAGARRFEVTTAEGKTHRATLRGTFPEGDLAVIRVEGASLTPATFADSSAVEVGEVALAIGNPLGLRSSVTQGIVSSTSRTVSEGNGIALPSVIQTSAPINPGNSGGALVNGSGAVIGIPTLSAVEPGMGGGIAPGIGFAISSNTVQSIAGQLARTGRVARSARAWLGVALRSLPQGGVVVAGVTRGGPAADAGMRPGDLIERFAGRGVATVDELAVALAGEPPGRAVPVVLGKDGGARTVRVTLGELPEAP